MTRPFEIGHPCRQTRTKQSCRRNLRRNGAGKVLATSRTVARATLVFGDERRLGHELDLLNYFSRCRQQFDRPTALRTRFIGVRLHGIDFSGLKGRPSEACAHRGPAAARMESVSSPASRCPTKGASRSSSSPYFCRPTLLEAGELASPTGSSWPAPANTSAPNAPLAEKLCTLAAFSSHPHNLRQQPTITKFLA